MPIPPALPPGITVLERGWLSANNILLLGDACALVDSGYATHAPQTLALVAAALGGRELDTLINTHLHSDHCGGNAALQQRYPQAQTLIPPGQSALVQRWDPVGLSYTPTGQHCPAFSFDALLQPGHDITLGALPWQVHAAAGHDPHSVVLFQAEHRVLISADALWERGFGVVFPELDGINAFAEVAATLDMIERLDPLTIIPGHGRMFTTLASSLAYARQRLEGFVRDPRRHALHAAKVLLKFQLLAMQRLPRSQLLQWACQTTHMEHTRLRHSPELSALAWAEKVADDLVSAGAAAVDNGELVNA